jgi:RHS repeat-associated protein
MKDWKLLARRSPILVCGLLGLTLARLTAVGIEPPNSETLPAPRFLSPNAGPEFSANQTPQDILHIRVFEELLIPIGGEPSPAENAALAEALRNFARRSDPDDFTSLTAFVERHPKSTWNTALLTGLGLEYYKSAYYSLALAAWKQALSLNHQPADLKGKLLVDRAICELAGLYSRLGRMDELEALLKSVEGQVFLGAATERVNLAREALWNMKNRPEISFRCGPLALQSIRRFLNSNATLPGELLESASTQKGLSLKQVAELAQKVGLNYRIAFREKGAPIIFPSVVHWRVGHFAAMLRFEGGHYYLEDATFVNSTWATEKAIESEASGYFLIPADRELPKGWRAVTAEEAGKVWGKGLVSGVDPDNYTPDDLQTGSCAAGKDDFGMAVARVHLGIANLQIRDTPVGYTPPVGPPVYFTVRYNQRDYVFPNYAATIPNGFGPQWIHDWYGAIGNVGNPLADVKYYVAGGGVRTFTGFNTNTQTFAPQQFDQTLLKRIGTNLATCTYELLFPDGSKKIFGYRGTNVAGAKLSQVVDPAGNAVTLNWQDFGLLNRLESITDAIGQVTTISYDHATQYGLITKITDPFGRFATFGYASFDLDHDNNPNSPPITIYSLRTITDVVGIQSQINYLPGNFVLSELVTPYGTNKFSFGGGPDAGRWVEIVYPDNSRERVEFNQSTNLGIGFSVAAGSVPIGMNTDNRFMWYRNTYYWDRNACAQGYGDYSKARVFHWLHTPNVATMSGILESTRNPLESRVWYDYDGQSSPLIVGTTDRPKHKGRVLDDGTTQLYTYGYNQFGHLTNMIDPVGRTFSLVYATNGIDLSEIRQTRGTNNDLLIRATYNNQHLPLTMTDASGQTRTNTYNARGQLLTTINPKEEMISFTYDANGYLRQLDGPLPGTNDSFSLTYDSFGRAREWTDLSGYTLTFDYDALNRPTRITYPDLTYTEYTYNRLDLVQRRDRAGRITTLDYDNMRRLTRVTDPLDRTTLLQWCDCGSLGSITDALGHTTSWERDVQGRLTGKKYADGSQVRYRYENARSLLQEIIDEKSQVTRFGHNRDNSLHSISHVNATVSTPPVIFDYDTNYLRLIKVVDGIGTNSFSYHPVGMSGAGRLAVEDGPWEDDSIAYQYDELRRLTNRAINGVQESWAYDAMGRASSYANPLGVFSRSFAGATRRVTGINYPDGQSSQIEYFPATGDNRLQRITHRRADASQLSRFTYGYDVIGNITTWQQEMTSQSETWTAQYDAADRLKSIVANQGGTNFISTTNTYDVADNRLIESVNGNAVQSQYNALNQLAASTGSITNATYEWDGNHRLVAINLGTNRSEFTYDGRGRLRVITEKQGGNTVSERRFLWATFKISEERDTNNVVVKRFFIRGEQRGGTNLYYFSDHLGSPRELTDTSSAIQAEYGYSPFGVRKKLAGNTDSPFGFTGLLSHDSSETLFAVYRAYSPRSGRWLSRDPIGERGGLNLYAYVGQNPLRWTDRFGYSPDYEAEKELFSTVWSTFSNEGTAFDVIKSVAELAEKPIVGTTVVVLEKVGFVMDGLQTGWSIGKAIDNPNGENISDAVVNCTDMAFTILAPEVALPVKAMRLLTDLLPKRKGVAQIIMEVQGIDSVRIMEGYRNDAMLDEMRLREDLSREIATGNFGLEDLFR